jgi:bifunctional non-homologous end joining protein LigD
MSARKTGKSRSSEAVEEQLKRYRAMRDFGITREPRGTSTARLPAAELPFVVQKHAASRLHYDFRLGWNGVLKSWAVAKGPSMNPADKRLAIQVEDHPIEYGGFEGIIPQGQYGGGTVMVWDYGTWEPQADHADVDAGLNNGSLKFTLHGTKLKGNWALVRMKSKSASDTKPAWLLIKEHDRYERGEEDTPITDEKPKSALTSRSMDAITKSEDHIWDSKHQASASTSTRPAKRASHSARHPQTSKTVRPAKRAASTEARPTHIKLTHPDKVLDDESGLTKQQLADYYWLIADKILPHIANRPSSIVRCPQGSSKPCFFQKHSTDTLPSTIESVLIKDKKSSKAEPYITISTGEALVALAQLGVLEIHPWGAKNDDLEHPDRIIIDLDPDTSIPWSTLASSADAVRKLFRKLDLDSFLKSTGGKGLHIVVPITPEHGWPNIKEFAHAVALWLERRDPQLYVTRMSKAERTGRIFIDYLRNERGATAIAPYSPRSRAGAPVAIPLPWSALNSPERPHASVRNAAEWNAGRDPWAKMAELKQRINLEECLNFLKG